MSKRPLAAGDFVKRRFTAHDGPERMWVEITGFRADGTILGTLANEPVMDHGGGLKHGDAVEVLPQEVLDAMYKEKA